MAVLERSSSDKRLAIQWQWHSNKSHNEVCRGCANASLPITSYGSDVRPACLSYQEAMRICLPVCGPSKNGSRGPCSLERTKEWKRRGSDSSGREAPNIPPIRNTNAECCENSLTTRTKSDGLQKRWKDAASDPSVADPCRAEGKTAISYLWTVCLLYRWPATMDRD